MLGGWEEVATVQVQQWCGPWNAGKSDSSARAVSRGGPCVATTHVHATRKGSFGGPSGPPQMSHELHLTIAGGNHGE